jgi:hypothetical protein
VLELHALSDSLGPASPPRQSSIGMRASSSSSSGRIQAQEQGGGVAGIVGRASEIWRGLSGGNRADLSSPLLAGPGDEQL